MQHKPVLDQFNVWQITVYAWLLFHVVRPSIERYSEQM